MFDVYINHYKSGNVTTDTETLMFSIPSSNGFPVSKPMVKASEDSAENFSFTIESNSPYYDALLPFKTIIRVVYDGDIIFFGRVMIVSSQTVWHTKNVTCEGMYSYLKDSYYEGKQEKHRNKITVAEYFQKIVDNHNTQIPEKHIYKGNIGVTLPTEKDRYEPTAWTQSSGLLNNLASNHGGHMRIRYEGLDPYLDWYKYYSRDLGPGLRPSVTVGKNILDLSSEQNVDHVFTKIIPIGGTSSSSGQPIYIDGCKYTDKNGQQHTHSGKVFPMSLMRELYTDEQLTDEFHDFKDYRDAEANYGTIYKTMSFSDAEKKEKLWDLTKKWIKESFFGLVTSFSVKAIDLHVTNGSLPKILIGDCVDVTYFIVKNGTTPQWETKKLVCKNIQYDLFNPENNTYTFGIPSDLLEYNRQRQKSSRDHSVSASAGQRAVPKGVEDEAITWEKVWLMIGDRDGREYPEYEGTACYDSFGENGELSGTGTFYDTADIPDGEYPTQHRDVWFTGTIIGKITLPGKHTKWVAVSESRGVFAYMNVSNPNPVRHWYINKSCKYEGTTKAATPTISTFEEIAQMIEKDTDATYGGQTVADQFRENGKLDGSVSCYDPDQTDDPGHNPESVFTATIVGKFGSSPITYVATSNEYGIFAYRHIGEFESVVHWYHRAAGTTYDNLKPFITEEDGVVSATANGVPDGDVTFKMETRALTGYGSVGTAVFGYDLTSSEDKWKIHLNTPFQYTDIEGVTRIADGFIKASDFKIEEIPSFKTKLAVVDVLIAGKVDAVEIAADIAYVRKINSENITAGTYMSAHSIHGTNIIASNRVEAANFYYEKETGSGTWHTDLERCFYDVGARESGGVITIDFSRADGTSKTVNFNMAATQFFIDSIAAAKDTGWNDARADIRSSLPSSATEPTSTNRNWPLYIPKSGYNSGHDIYNISVSGLEDYTQSGTTRKVVNVKVGDYIAYRKEIPLQDKGTINPTESEQTITPVSGYYGISQVKIGAAPLEDKGTINPTQSEQTITAGSNYYGMSQVKIGAALLEDKGAINPTASTQDIITGAGYYGMSHVRINAAPLQDKGTVNPNGSAQDITPGSGYYGISHIKIGAAPLEDKGTIYPSSSAQTITPSSGYYGISQVKVGAALLEDRGTVTPGTSNRDIYPSSGYYGIAHVKLAGDADLVASNIKKDVSIFGVTGTYEGSGGGGYTSDDLQIDSYYSNPIEPTADKTADNMRDKILEAVNGNEWFRFRVYLQGTSPLVSKTYKMKF